MFDLSEKRSEIDAVDRQIASLFVKRMEICREIALYKKNNQLEVKDCKREEQIKNAEKTYVPSEFLDYFSALHDEMMSLSKDYQKKLNDD